jgi:hypothetical protein
MRRVSSASRRPRCARSRLARNAATGALGSTRQRRARAWTIATRVSHSGARTSRGAQRVGEPGAALDRFGERDRDRHPALGQRGDGLRQLFLGGVAPGQGVHVVDDECRSGHEPLAERVDGVAPQRADQLERELLCAAAHDRAGAQRLGQRGVKRAQQVGFSRARAAVYRQRRPAAETRVAREGEHLRAHRGVRRTRDEARERVARVAAQHRHVIDWNQRKRACTVGERGERALECAELTAAQPRFELARIDRHAELGRSSLEAARVLEECIAGVRGQSRRGCV